MRGSKDSVLSRLKKINPNLFDIHCLAHCFALIGSKAGKFLPNNVDELVTKLSNYFSASPKRTNLLLKIEIELDINNLKILKKAGTRWISIQQCVDRILKLFPAIEKYFMENNDDSSKEKFTKIKSIILR